MATPTISINKSDLGLANGPSSITPDTVAAALNTVYFIAGIVAVLIIIIGGVRYVTSNGDSSQVTAAKNTILYAVVGLVVIIMAAAITQFVVTNVTK
jgi:TRAP-type C4-dicarboxylate transport system permease small subunit